MAAMGAVVDAVFGSYDLKNAKQWRDEDMQHREQEKQWREDAISREIAWRNADLERERRVLKLENEKRIIDARHNQLSAIARLSALLAGFSMVSMVEINLPEGTNHMLLVFYGGVCCLEVRELYGRTAASIAIVPAYDESLTVCCMLCVFSNLQFIFMLICMLTCTLLLLAVTRFVTHTLEGEVRQLTVVELELVSPFYAWWLKRCEREWQLAYQLFRFGASLFLVEVVAIGWVQFGQSVITAVVMTVSCVVGILYYQLRVASRWRYLVNFPDPNNVNQNYHSSIGQDE